MPKSRSSRPANRPSRRHEILQAAVELLAVQPPDEIAVSDIAAHCGMTPAAFYYHFSSKDEILDEIVEDFSAQWSDVVGTALGKVKHREDLAECVDEVLAWVEENERPARVYFVTSIGATSACEAVRRRTRNDLGRRAARALRETAPQQDRIRLAIAGLGLITLLEIVSRSRLELDASYRTLGPVRFRATAAQLAESLVH
ncbi:MAG: TetR family transcriptional regulator [Actinomycetales bacterium]|nr:TetR family transcriptional regulator [Actinomycetales bacterium]